jgi:hypothetical protein
MTSPRRNLKYRQPLQLLGEQREQPRLQAALDRWGIRGPVGLVAAGWEEDEFDDAWVQAAISAPLFNSKLYEFADQLFAEDPEVLTLLRQRQDKLRELREVNQLQTDHLGAVARELLRQSDPGDAFAEPLALTFKQLREVDSQYMRSVNLLIRDFDRKIAPGTRPSIFSYRRRVLDRLRGCRALLIAGGHIGVLLNRLKLSRLLDHLDVPVIAWSGGAMALGDQVCFYHHFIPHADGQVELSRYGMRWFSGLQLFPRARDRLDWSDRVELALLSRRIKGRCLLLDRDSELEWSSSRLTRASGVRALTSEGLIEEWQP